MSQCISYNIANSRCISYNVAINTKKFSHLVQCSKDSESGDKDDTKKIVYHPTSEEDKWKEGFLRELVQVKDNHLEVEGFEPGELDDILEHICVR